MPHSKVRRSPRLKRGAGLFRRSVRLVKRNGVMGKGPYWRRHPVSNREDLRTKTNVRVECGLYMIRFRWGGREGPEMTKFGISEREVCLRLGEHADKEHYWQPRLCGLWAIESEDVAARSAGLRGVETSVLREMRRRRLLQTTRVPGTLTYEREIVGRWDEPVLVACLERHMTESHTA